jgi:hypothetical protein
MALGETVYDDLDVLRGEGGGACSTQAATRCQNQRLPAGYSEIDADLLLDRNRVRPVKSL